MTLQPEEYQLKQSDQRSLTLDGSFVPSIPMDDFLGRIVCALNGHPLCRRSKTHIRKDTFNLRNKLGSEPTFVILSYKLLSRFPVMPQINRPIGLLSG